MKSSRLFASLLFFSLVMPAHAALFDDEEARRRIEALRNDVDVRLKEFDAKVESLPRNLVLTNEKIEQLRVELAKLRGQVEVLVNDMEQTQKRQKDFYVDLDNRLRKLEGEGQKAAVTATPPVDAAAEAKEYEVAINALRANRMIDAAFGFRSFIKTYPKSTLLPGAHFWAGMAHLKARDPATAKDFFTKMFTDWPDDPMAPDAMLGLADAQEALKEVKGARTTLEQLVAKYPNSEAAKSAKPRLAKK